MAVAIIGAGIAGLACAQALAAAGVTALDHFDKGRGPGGRASTRRASTRQADGDLRFDHGAQYFRVRDPAFQALVTGWEAAGRAARWPGQFATITNGVAHTDADETPRYVGTPRMNALVAGDAEAVRFGAQATALTREGDVWWVTIGESERAGPYRAVALAIPSVQAATLLAPVAPALKAHVEQAVLAPCWAVMAAYETRPAFAFDGALVEGGPVAWVAREASKPGRMGEGPSAWVLHSAPAWTRKHLENTADAVTAALTDAFACLCDAPPPALVHASAHRWRYARVETPLGAPMVWDADLGLGACGDWCLGPRIEAAWQSGHALGERMAERLS